MVSLQSVSLDSFVVEVQQEEQVDSDLVYHKELCDERGVSVELVGVAYHQEWPVGLAYCKCERCRLLQEKSG